MTTRASTHGPARLIIYTVVTVLVAAVLSIHFLAGITAPLLSGQVLEGQMLGRDFVNFWAASVLAWKGEFATIFNTTAFNAALRDLVGRELGFQAFPYPPHGLWVVLPLGFLPYRPALAAWLIVTFVLFAIATLWGRRRFALETLILLIAPASLINIATGQNGFLTAALLVGGLRNIESRPVVAGILFGLLSFKPQLGLLLPFALAAGRHWRTFGAAAVTVILLVVASIGAFGLETWHIYLREGLAIQQAFLQHGTGMFQVMIPSTLMAGRILGLPLGVAVAAQALVALVALIGCIRAFRRRAPLELHAAALVVGTFLATPYSFNYDLVAVAAVSILVADRLSDSVGSRQALVANWFLPLLLMHLSSVGVPLGPVVLMALFGVLLHRIRLLEASSRPRDAGQADRTAIVSVS